MRKPRGNGNVRDSHGFDIIVAISNENYPIALLLEMDDDVFLFEDGV
jgi:hypothetical protein